MNALATIPTPLAERMKPDEFDKTASHMAREYAAATAEMARLMRAIGAQAERLYNAFDVAGEEERHHSYRSFGISFEYNGHRERNDDGTRFDSIFAAMKRNAWTMLVDALGIKNIMSVANRKLFEHQLSNDELPDITEDNIKSIIFGLAGQAKDFAQKAAIEVLDILRPRGHWGGQYKTNDAFRVGRRVILSWMVDRGYSGNKFRVNYNKEQHLTAIDAVFHLLDGKGIMREHRGPLVEAINTAEGGRGETEYFKFKCFKNRNLHLEMKRLDLVRELNLKATGEAILGDDMEGD